MKFTNVVRICLGAVLMMLLFAGCAWFRGTYVLEDTKSLAFGYSTGNMANARVKYTLLCENGTCTATVKEDGVAEEEAVIIAVDEAFVHRVEALLQSYDVQKWNGFQKSDKYVLDGKDFDMYMQNHRGQYFSASGYMKWPKGYDEVKKGLDELFGGLLKEEVQ